MKKFGSAPTRKIYSWGLRNIALHFPILRQQQSRLQTTSMLALLDFGPICIPIHEYDINKNIKKALKEKKFS